VNAWYTHRIDTGKCTRIQLKRNILVWVLLFVLLVELAKTLDIFISFE
jgi:hypothetical protein